MAAARDGAEWASISASRVWISAIWCGSVSVSAASSRSGAFAVAGEDGIDQGLGAARRFLGDGSDLGPAGHPDRAGFGAKLAQNDAEKG